jgi:glutaredoxin
MVCFYTCPFVVLTNGSADGTKLHDELKKLTKQTTVPYIFIKGKFVGGYTDFVRTSYSKDLKAFIEQSKTLANRL